MTVAVGEKIADFSIEATGDKVIRLSDAVGQWVILYFYPKDSTPGCTKEARCFREVYAGIKAHHASVWGVSRDSVPSHEKFKAKCDLPYDLLSDYDGMIGERFGVIKPKSLWGKTFLGIERSTFLIDGQGYLRYVWRKVSVSGHAEAVVAKLIESVKPL